MKLENNKLEFVTDVFNLDLFTNITQDQSGEKPFNFGKVPHTCTACYVYVINDSDVMFAGYASDLASCTYYALNDPAGRKTRERVRDEILNALAEGHKVSLYTKDCYEVEHAKYVRDQIKKMCKPKWNLRK
jgi:hypothetical protein